MDEIFKLESVSQYNTLMGQETLHPLVSVINCSNSEMIQYMRMNLGLYAIFLKNVKCGDMRYGRNNYDYQKDTLLFVAPGQIIGFVNIGEYFQPQGWALVFHSDLIRGTSLSHKMKEYTFFSYEVNEALHLSDKEEQIVLDCLNKIDFELRQSIDKHSRTLIVSNIELLLNYCIRFYDRQFITRANANSDILVKFEKILDDYFQSEKPQTLGLPSVEYFANQLFLSANYFGDLIKKETGKSAQEYVYLKLMDIAKEKVLDTTKSINEIAYELGFKYSQHFSRMFKKNVGYTPTEYRLQN
jgi:Response regulator containing CheY-like receiver domain and AraC-type DNA-binding domain